VNHAGRFQLEAACNFISETNKSVTQRNQTIFMKTTRRQNLLAAALDGALAFTSAQAQ
jgi:hypothetical protein